MSDKVMSLRKLPGDKVRYAFPDNGWQEDQELAKTHLTLNEVYAINYIKIGDSTSYIYLEGFSDYYFNTVLFADHWTEEQIETLARAMFEKDYTGREYTWEKDVEPYPHTMKKTWLKTAQNALECLNEL